MLWRLRNFVRGLSAFVFATLAEHVSVFLLIFGIGGLAIGVYSTAVSAYATFAYSPAQAKIVQAGWRCGPYIGIEEHACTDAEAESFRARGVRAEFLITYRYADDQGTVHETTSDLSGTAMRQGEARPGVTFDLLYDPNDPTRTALPLGTHSNALTAGLIGIAAMGLYALLFWRRRKKTG
jgi:LPXTG-motif cell wall-anchored protein